MREARRQIVPVTTIDLWLERQAQTDLPILGAGHPDTTRTQKGLAVFAELISGAIELDRRRHLIAVLTFNVSTNHINLGPLVEVAKKILERAPLVRMPALGVG